MPTGMKGRPFTLEDTLKVNPDVVFRELDGEAVLLDLETGIYLGLNEAGTKIWYLLQEHGSLRRVFDTMLREYEVAPEVLEKDLCQLASQLCEKGLASAEGQAP